MKTESREEAFDYIVHVLKKDNVSNQTLDENAAKLVSEIASRNKVLMIMQEILQNKGNMVLGNNETAKERTRKLYKARLEMLMPILKDFENEGIKYAVLKGAYLGDSAYANMGIRTSNDVDVLISKKDIRRIKEICFQHGFVMGKSDRINQRIVKYERVQELAFLYNTHQLATFVKVGANDDFTFYDTVIDFNFKITWGEYQGNAIMSDVFLEHVEKIEDSNHFAYYVLSPNYNFIQLCLHAYKEANGVFFVELNSGLFLRAFLDIYYYIIENVNELDITELLKISYQNKIESYIYFILIIIHEIFGKNQWIESILEKLSDNAETEILDRFGLEETKPWDKISLKERFYSTQISDYLAKTLTEKEWEKIRVSSQKFY